MTPHRSHGRGSFVIDRQFRGVGRIRRASGVTSAADLRAINTMMTKLAERRRTDYLIALKEGRLHPVDLLLQIDKFGWDSLQSLPAPRELVPLADAWTEWSDAILRRNTRRMYAFAWKRLEPHIPDPALLTDLPPALIVLRESLLGHAPSFNRIRASVQAFVKHRVGTKHHVYRDLEGVEKIRERPSRRVGLPIDRCLEIRDALPLTAARAWWDLVVHGLRIGEYYQQDGVTWTVNREIVRVHGRKSDAADRIVPRLTEMERPMMPVRAFRLALRAFDVTPHIARYSFKSLAEDAGIPENRVEQYMGRSVRGMSGLYSRVNLVDWVEQDRGRLLAYLDAAEQRRPAVARGGLRRA